MGLIAKEGATSSITPIEEGTYPAICYSIIDLGIQINETFNNESRKIILSWEVCGEFVEFEGEPRPRVISKTYTLSLNEKSNLRKDLVSWRGCEFTAEELEGFELRNILKAPCLINVVHTKKESKIYTNVSGVMKLPKGMKVPELINEAIEFDIEESPIEMIDTFPKFIQDTIRKSKMYLSRLDPLDDFEEDEEAILPF